MFYNNLLLKITRVLDLLLIPFIFIITFIFGILAIVPFVGLILSLIFELFISIFVIWPLFLLSYLFLNIRMLRPIFGFLGIAYSLIAYCITIILPSFGDNNERMMRILYLNSFPFNKPLYLVMALKELPSDDVKEDLQAVINKSVKFGPNMILYINQNIIGFPWCK